MIKRLCAALGLLVALSLTLTVTTAQNEDPEPREIYTALAYGDEVFEADLWRASAEEQDAYTSALWRYKMDSNVLVFLLYLHFDGGATPEAIADYFDDEGFQTLLANYQPYRRTATCTVGDITVYEFLGKQGAKRTLLRYWVKPVSATRVLAVNAVFPEDQVDMLDTYALRLFPEAPSCDFEGVG